MSYNFSLRQQKCRSFFFFGNSKSRSKNINRLALDSNSDGGAVSTVLLPHLSSIITHSYPQTFDFFFMEHRNDHVDRVNSPESTLPIATPFPPSEQNILTYLQEYCRTRTSKSPIYKFLLSDASIVHALRGHFVSRLLLTPAHLNSSGGLHGSVTATIIDWAGGLAIAAWDCRDNTGVSVDINVSYVNTAREGDEIEIEGLVEKVGGSLAFTTVKIFKVEEGKRGKLVATGRHTKFVRQR